MVKAYPLSWPMGVARQAANKARFKKGRSIKQAFSQLSKELKKLGATNIVISSNLELKSNGEPYSTSIEPKDTGVAVYFSLKGKQYSMPCDRWNSATDNLWALCCHISAMRGQNRWGVASVEQAFAGFKSLAGTTQDPYWWEVLGVSLHDATKDLINAAYRERAKELHPDLKGGDSDRMKMLNVARDKAFLYLSE